ncbi:hypothetical protein [Paenibacillus sp. OAE614]
MMSTSEATASQSTLHPVNEEINRRTDDDCHDDGEKIRWEP